jgi:ABC-type sugar transport system substrate-binding protein
MQDAAAHMGVEVTILGPDKFDVEKTAALIDQAVASAPDGMGVVITDNQMFKPPIMKAIDAGIPVVAYDTGLGPEGDQIPYLTFWGAEDYVGLLWRHPGGLGATRCVHQPPGWSYRFGCRQGL